MKTRVKVLEPPRMDSSLNRLLKQSFTQLGFKICVTFSEIILSAVVDYIICRR